MEGVNMLRIFTRPRRKLKGVNMLRIFLPHFSILGGQYLPDCHKKQCSKSTEKSNFLPEAGGQLGPDYPVSDETVD
jgi:hypothetical protein